MAEDTLQELIEAAHGVLRYLRVSTDPTTAGADISEFARRAATLSAGGPLEA